MKTTVPRKSAAPNLGKNNRIKDVIAAVRVFDTLFSMGNIVEVSAVLFCSSLEEV
jgi:hypothetical protein